jgi:hypothetical protein
MAGEGTPPPDRKLAITVAAIAAVGTIIAAVIATGNKPKEQVPSTQQTSYGSGAVNVGRDAFISNNVKSPAEEAAQRVQACEERHGMKSAFEKSESEETIPATNIEEAQYISHITFQSCAWPKSPHSDEDGYLEIKIRTVKGPGDAEYTGTTYADRITAPCQQLEVQYQLGHMGEYHNEDPFVVKADTVVVRETQHLWRTEDGSLPFYPALGEFVVLHNSHYGLGSAKCREYDR